MAHPEMEAAETTAPTSASDKAAEFEKFLFADEDEQDDDPEAEEQEGAEEGEDLELDDEDEQDDEADEPETAIDAPVSLNAAEKAVFAQLPPEAQEAWAASETRRNSQVQEATTKASNAQREAEQRAAAADAEAQARFAQQLDVFAKALEPQMPDPSLAYENPGAYIAAKARYDADLAQHEAFVQQVRGIGAEAESKQTEAVTAERVADLMTHPKLADPAARDDYLKSSMALVADLGLDPAAFEQVASASDFRALDKIAEKFAKADKFDQAMAKQMQKVRAAKGKSLRPNAAPTSSRAASADNAWQRVKQTGKNKSAQADAMAEWLEASGHM